MISNRKILGITAIILSLILIITIIIPYLPISLDVAKFNDDYTLVNVFPGLEFNLPVDLQSPPDDSNQVFIVEQAGKIYRINTTKSQPEKILFLDISDRVKSGGELGLLGLAFHPNFSTNGYFFIDFTHGDATQTRVSRFTSNIEFQVNYTSEVVILNIHQPFSNHNAGAIAFGPDGYFYITLGDGGSGGDPMGNGQNLETLLGSILRVDVNIELPVLNGNNYSIPSDNPFVGDGNRRGEIYAYGLRNPWRMSFDNQTNKFWVGDVGQSSWEEINIIQKGGNYGWNIMEGMHCFRATTCDKSGLIDPIFEYGRNLGASITGGYVYRGANEPKLYGYYIFGDYVSGRIWWLDNNNGQTVDVVNFIKADVHISSFGVDPEGEIFVVDHAGSIYDIVEK